MKQINFDRTPNITQCDPLPPLSPPKVDEYREYLDEFEITEDQKTELLSTLWWIMVSFVDMGFGVDAVQRCLPGLKEFGPTSGTEFEATQAQRVRVGSADGDEHGDKHAE